MVVLPRVDSAYIYDSQFTEDYKKWLANLVDTLNSALSLIEDELMSVDARLTAGGL